MTTTEGEVFPFPAADPLMLPKQFAWFRSNEPIPRVRVASGDEVWLITRYDDVRAVMSDQRFSRNLDRPDAARVLPGARMLSSPIADAPAHTRWRRLVSKAFTARQVEQMRGGLKAIVDGLLDDIEAQPQPVDLMSTFAIRLPVAALCALLDMTTERHGGFREVAGTLQATGSTPQEKAGAFRALGEYTREVIAERRHNLGSDLLSRMIEVHDEGDDRLSEDELVSTVQTLLIGGYETTAYQIGKSLYALFRYPDQLALLRADPSSLNKAVEELLRFAGAVDSGYGTPRYATEDIKIGDTMIPKGATVMVMRQSANRDETKFTEPDRLDITRDAGKHLGFGVGSHHCLGASLVRLELELGFSGLLQRFPRLALAIPVDEVEWVYRLTTSGPAALPATW
jgi:cytochrome P450